MKTVLLLIFAVISLSASQKWTVMFYMMSAPDLEEAVVTNMIELSDAGGNDRVNVFAQIDWTLKQASAEKRKYFPEPEDSGALRYKITKGRKIELVKKLGEINSGSGNELKSFIKSCIRSDVSNYILVIGGHGSGYESYNLIREKCISYDDCVNDSLSAKEISDALDYFRSLTGTTMRFSVFDSCLSLNLELACDLYQKTLYMAASEDSIIIDSCDYGKIISSISVNSSCGLNEICRDITDAFCLDYSSNTSGGVFSCFTSSGAKEIGTWLDALSRNLLKLGKKPVFYGISGFGQEKRYQDIGSLCHAVIEGKVSFKNDPLYSSCRENADSLLSSIIVNRASFKKTGLYYWQNFEGISIWLPSADRYRDYRKIYKSGNLAKYSLWDEFLDWYLLDMTKEDILKEKKKEYEAAASRMDFSDSELDEKLEVLERIQEDIIFFSASHNP